MHMCIYEYIYIYIYGKVNILVYDTWVESSTINWNKCACVYHTHTHLALSYVCILSLQGYIYSQNTYITDIYISIYILCIFLRGSRYYNMDTSHDGFLSRVCVCWVLLFSCVCDFNWWVAPGPSLQYAGHQENGTQSGYQENHARTARITPGPSV